MTVRRPSSSTALLLAGLLLAACATSNSPTAVADDGAESLEQACIDAAAPTFGVQMSDIRVTRSTTDASGVTTVLLDVNGSGATCTVNADGHVRDVSYGQ